MKVVEEILRLRLTRWVLQEAAEMAEKTKQEIGIQIWEDGHFSIENAQEGHLLVTDISYSRYQREIGKVIFYVILDSSPDRLVYPSFEDLFAACLTQRPIGLARVRRLGRRSLKWRANILFIRAKRRLRLFFPTNPFSFLKERGLESLQKLAKECQKAKDQAGICLILQGGDFKVKFVNLKF